MLNLNPLSDTDKVRLVRLNALLGQALAMPRAARAQWLADLPAADRALSTRLAELLARAEVETDDFLSQPLSVRIEDLASLQARPDQPGDAVGPYRLLHELGAGGMATVWLAERLDKSLQRQIALKLPREGWALGLAQRMARERDILATLEHPLIARLYEAGVSEAGRPWLAMEHVLGEPIDTHCSKRALPLPARVALVLQVLDAVAYAHGRLVVHRDLKPGNILVTPAGQVRLLDFGVAKLLLDDGAAQPGVTQMNGRAITPDYAAPEQIAGRAVTVAADVYSMGVLLFELLSGKRPFERAGRSIAALEDAVTRAERPLASSRAADAATARQLRGDLDAIVDKALRIDPALRYASAEAFSADLQRWQNGLPVLAQRQSRGYRAWKFLRRHRAGVLAGALLLLAVSVGLVGTLSQATRAEQLARQAQQERDVALRELDYSEASTSFMQLLLTEGSGKPFTTAELLARADQAVDTQYAGDPALRARLQLMLAELYGSVKDLKQMAVVLDRAQASVEAARSPALMANLQCTRAGLLATTGRLDEAAALFAATMPRLHVAAAGDVGTLVACHGSRAMALRLQQRPSEALDDVRRALNILGAPTAARLQMFANLHATQASAHSALGQAPQAIAGLQSAIDQLQAAGLMRSATGAALVNNLGVSLWRIGQHDYAIKTFERWLAPATAPELVREHVIATNYGRLLSEAGRADEGLRWLARAQGASIERGDIQSSAYIALGFATAHCARHDWVACDAAIAAARDALSAVRQPGHVSFGDLEMLAAQSWWARGDLRRARAALDIAIPIFQAARQSGLGGRAEAFALLARIDAQSGNAAAAEDHAQAAADAARVVASGFAHSSAMATALLAQGVVKRAQGDEAAAAKLLRDALENAQRSGGNIAPVALLAKALIADTSLR